MYMYILGTNRTWTCMYLARFLLLNASHFLKINIPDDSKTSIAHIRGQFRSTTNDTHKTKYDVISGDFAERLTR